MTWKPSEDIDREIRRWMKAKCWEVTVTDYHFDQEIYDWRHRAQREASPTLRISREVLEDYPAFAILELLDRLNVAAAIRTDPAARLVVAQNASRVTLERLPGR